MHQLDQESGDLKKKKMKNCWIPLIILSTSLISFQQSVGLILEKSDNFLLKKLVALYTKQFRHRFLNRWPLVAVSEKNHLG